MNLITALLIFTGEHTDLKDRMQEAANKIFAEDLKQQSILCSETITALKKMKKRGKK